MFDLALGIFLFLSPVVFLPCLSFPLLNGKIAALQFYQYGIFKITDPALIQHQFYQYGIVALFLVALASKPVRPFRDKYLSFLLMVCVLGVIWHPKTMQNFRDIFLGFLLYYLVVAYTKNIRVVLRAVVAICSLNTAFAILQFFRIHIFYLPKYAAHNSFGGSEIIGLMSYKSQVGIYQAVALPICFAFSPLLSIIPAVGLLLSNSITATIPAIIGMAYLLRKKLIRIHSYPIIMCVVLSSCLLFIRYFHKLTLRFDVWLLALRSITKQWFYGYGAGTFKFMIEGKTYPDPYSLYLGTGYAFGILGIMALALFLKDKFRGSRNGAITAACLILVLCGFGYSLMDYPRLSGTSIVLFGFLAIAKRKGDEVCL